MIEKLNEIDDILSDIENRLKGTEGDNCTKARGLLQDVIKELTAFSKGPEPVPGRQYGHIDGFNIETDSWPLNPH